MSASERWTRWRVGAKRRNWDFRPGVRENHGRFGGKEDRANEKGDNISKLLHRINENSPKLLIFSQDISKPTGPNGKHTNENEVHGRGTMDVSLWNPEEREESMGTNENVLKC